MIEVLKNGGVNRLSVGIQTFDDDARKLLGRRGSGEFAASRVAAAIKAGISNTNVDIIYNYPAQADAQLESDLETVLRLDVAGISLYSLVLHEKTPLYRRLDEKTKTDMLNMRREKELFDMIFDKLEPRGYKMLELTKLVKNGRDRYDYMNIRHSGGSCIALGHGAGGNIEDYFYHNSHASPDISDKIHICSRGRVLRPEYRLLDSLIYSMQKGSVRLNEYSQKLGIDLLSLFGEKLDTFAGAGYLDIDGDKITFTRNGVFFGNNIISELIGVISGE